MYRIIIVWIRNCFGFSRTESNAYLVLIGLLIGVHFCLGRFPGQSVNNPETRYFDSLIINLSGIPDTAVTKAPVFTRFDPNLIHYDSLLAMGMPRFIASNLIRYREAGGIFKSPEDLMKLYGMTDTLWSALRPWINFEPSEEHPGVTTDSQNTGSDVSQSIDLKDLNKVDSLWLMKINGIGKVLSRRIVKYRNLLGGFHSMQQLAEVYHLPEEIIEALKKRVFIDTTQTPLNKIKVNQMDYLQIASHPYFSFVQAKAIVSYRDQHGLFKNLEDLKKIHLIDDSTYLRVCPYVDF